MFRPQEISATDARKYFSQIINKVQFSSKSFVVKSYRKPTVRIVKEQYIAALEQVLGKKTVAQVLEISANDNLPEFAKVEDIKKVFQRRLSGGSRSQPQPLVQKGQNVGVEHARPAAPKPQAQKPQPEKANPRTSNPHPPAADPTSNDRGVLLLSNGKNYA